MYKWTASWFNHYCTGILSTITKISKAVQFWSEFLGKVELYQTPCLPSFKYHHTLQMVREYKRKSPAPKWSSFESMSEALVSVIFGAMPMWRAVDIWRHTDWKSCWYLETYRLEELLIFGDMPMWRAVDIWRHTDVKSCWYLEIYRSEELLIFGDVPIRRAVDIFRVPYATCRDRIAKIYLVLVLGACEVVSLTKVRRRLVTNTEIRASLVKGIS